MERRGFLKGLAALVGGVALEQAIPFGRVFGFPKEIKCLNTPTVISATIEQYSDFYPPNLANLATVYYDKMALQRLTENSFNFTAMEKSMPLPKRTGQTIQLYRLHSA